MARPRLILLTLLFSTGCIFGTGGDDAMLTDSGEGTDAATNTGNDAGEELDADPTGDASLQTDAAANVEPGPDMTSRRAARAFRAHCAH